MADRSIPGFAAVLVSLLIGCSSQVAEESPPRVPPPPPRSAAAPSAAKGSDSMDLHGLRLPPGAKLEGTYLAQMRSLLFRRGTDELAGGAELTLDDIRQFLVDNPKVTKLRIETNSAFGPGAAENDQIARRRAVYIVHWLTGHGVDPRRLVAVSFGDRKPLPASRGAAKETTDVRLDRTEFHIAEIDGRPYLDQRIDGGGAVVDVPPESP